ncbi:TonB-dependent receptor [Phenylobacterium sp.]|uniref:TonB-dependent receptor n=1 Tax=Phenylobacterium sp. TaxID=1871053 RepID=UPI00273136B7|nr:TonB-dependent receptor [Phenylobacterium sp.]MDP1618974.1 TonB-dependent receptor [Phenylobacterium sp.]MDP1989310.1 TonB-dependent receptor [Phenylobacterium sp.]
MNHTLRLRSLFVMGVSTAAIVAATPAFAQQATMLEELVVTAERRDQSLQDVPVAVTAFTSERRDILGVATVEDLARVTPSLSYTNNDRLSIRGFGRLTNAIGTDPSVALYSDGIFSNSMADASTPSLFIERTEVLRGPQGTLYGRNSIGGAMNIISKRPTDDFQGEVRGTFGNYEYYRADALIRGPVTDGLRFLLGGSMERRDKGFIENSGPADDATMVDRWMIEAQLEADLGENITARMRYSKFNWDDSTGVGNTFENVVSPYDTTSLAGSGTSALYYNTTFGFNGANPGSSDPLSQNTNFTSIGKLSDHHRLHFDLTWDMDWATLKYYGGYQQYTYDTASDNDLTARTGPQNINIPDLDGPGPLTPFTATGVSTDARTFYQERQKWWSNELNLSSNSDGPLQWIVGVYQYAQSYDQPQGIRVVGDPSMFQPLTLAGAPAAANPRGAFLYVDGHIDVTSYATFGQIDYELNDTWTLTAGLRYTKDEKDGFDIARYVARLPTLAASFAQAGIPLSVGQGFAVDITTLQVCGTTTLAGCAANPATADLVPNAGGGLRRDLAGDWDALTGTLGLQWQPDAATNAYLRYSRGYKSGGWIGSNGLTPNPYADPEYVDSYELGLKRDFAGNFRLNAALFYSDYQGFQTPLTVPLGAITATQFLNLDATVWGLETEMQWSPVNNLQLFLNYAYLNSELTTGCCYVDTADPFALQPNANPTGAPLANGNRLQSLEGNNLPLAPENKVSLGGTYAWDLAAGTLTAGATYTYTADKQTTVFAQPGYTAGETQVADFRLLYRDIEDRYTIIGFVKNAFDEEGIDSSVVTTPSAAGARQTVKPIFPRTFGVELQYRF